MGHRTEILETNSLLLDVANARLSVRQENQREAEKSLAILLGDQLVNIAKDVVENGMDPLSVLAVVPDSEGEGKYIVLEGNRRLLSIRSLLNPEIISGVVSSGRERKIRQLSEIFFSDPIREIPCVVFDDPSDAWHWIKLRHTGANGGVGLVAWSTDDQDRWRSRHVAGGTRTPAGQIIDFVDKFSGQKYRKGMITNLDRLISTKEVRDRIGIEVKNKTVYANYEFDEMLKVLTYIVDDLSTKNVKVVYYKDDRLDYISKIPQDVLPEGDLLFGPPVPISELEDSKDSPVSGDTPEGGGGADVGSDSDYTSEEDSGSASEGNGHRKGVGTSSESDDSNENGVSGKEEGKDQGDREGAGRSSRSKARADRNTVIPRSFVVYIPEGRINEMYHELKKMELDRYVNACAVLFRVFVELSVDSYIAHHSVISEQERRSLPLAKRMKKVAEHLLDAGKIEPQLERAVSKIADGVGPLGTSTTTFNQYVHNPYVFPKPSELRAAWDELAPFMQKVLGR